MKKNIQKKDQIPVYNPYSAWQATAQLDACSRAHGARRQRPWLSDPVAEFVRLAWGEPPAWRALHPLYWMGVCARSLILDRGINSRLAAWSGEQVSVWSLGAGFDARWARLPLLKAGTVVVHEWDEPALLQAKRKLLSHSPWADIYKNVRSHALCIEDEHLPANVGNTAAEKVCDTSSPAPEDPAPAWEKALLEAAAEEKGKVLVIAEGLFDLLPLQRKTRLLQILARSLPDAALLFDSLNESAAAYDNKNPARYTGDSKLLAHGMEDDAARQGLENGWLIHKAQSVFEEIQGCPLEGVWRAFARLPLSAAMRTAYRCFSASPARPVLNSPVFRPARLDLSSRKTAFLPPKRHKDSSKTSVTTEA